ncbi:hypothetical protein UlMin_018674 [Ulmus minor]
MARFILLQERKIEGESQLGFGFGLCFYCTSSAGETCYLAVLFVEMSDDQILQNSPQVIWSANRDIPVGVNAVLSFTASQNLEVFNARGAQVWSTHMPASSASDMSINEIGNFVLLDSTGGTVWQSSDHLTDTLVGGQVLRKEHHLTSSISSTNMSSGLFNLCINSNALSAYSEGDQTIRYLYIDPTSIGTASRVVLLLSILEEIGGSSVLNYINFGKDSVSFCYDLSYIWDGKVEGWNETIPIPIENQFSVVWILRFDYDGGLRIYGWGPGKKWKKIYAFVGGKNECQFPLKCGRYGLCEGGYCTCPTGIDGVKYFEPIDRKSRNHGCRQIHVRSSEGTSDHYKLVNFGNLSYYSYADDNQAIPGLEDVGRCIEACRRNISCKAAFFQSGSSSLSGYCYLVSDVFSLIKTPKNSAHISSAYIKILFSSKMVPIPSPSPKHSDPSSFNLILSSSFTCVLFVLMGALVYMLILQNNKINDWKDHGFLKKVSSEFPARFCYSELRDATAKFTEKLGKGGFGTVFKGVLKDGTVVAVKRLEKTDRGTKEFLAEVGTIGNIHHVNLVKLIGFCANRRHRMLVYEFMSNGSLEKWIYCRNRNATLDWDIRKKIAMDIAKGLMYLHEDCRHKIAHLDVKPHNILLDANFSAKVSDFGLSKLINRDESQVVTEARGTLGYLAPEWENSRITVKADVYSFGIVLLEIVCSRKILDYSQPHSDVHLLTLLRTKASENRLWDMVVGFLSEDMQIHVEEATDMIKLGMWCSDGDHTRRPSMSLVVKILEGGFPLELDTNPPFPLVPAISSRSTGDLNHLLF